MSTKGGIFPPTPRFNEIYDRSLPSPKLFQHIEGVPIAMGRAVNNFQSDGQQMYSVFTNHLNTNS